MGSSDDGHSHPASLEQKEVLAQESIAMNAFGIAWPEKNAEGNHRIPREEGTRRLREGLDQEETRTAEGISQISIVYERVGEWGLVKKMSVPAHDNHTFDHINTYLTRKLKLFYQTLPLRRAILAA
jgi:hypothetical protein